jgi:hypothetical protein
MENKVHSGNGIVIGRKTPNAKLGVNGQVCSSMLYSLCERLSNCSSTLVSTVSGCVPSGSNTMRVHQCFASRTAMISTAFWPASSPPSITVASVGPAWSGRPKATAQRELVTELRKLLDARRP